MVGSDMNILLPPLTKIRRGPRGLHGEQDPKGSLGLDGKQGPREPRGIKGEQGP